MQYILSQEELDKLVQKAELDTAKLALEKARELILKATGHRCIYARADGSRGMRDGYCDDCPVGAVKLPYATSKQICPKTHHYSK